ncbi:MAG: hypothetical protein KDA30_02550 [Phycisphaerales bacterium]|nr:hypothetical protein [Phycisphaerales bacterium]
MSWAVLCSSSCTVFGDTPVSVDVIRVDQVPVVNIGVFLRSGNWMGIQETDQQGRAQFSIPDEEAGEYIVCGIWPGEGFRPEGWTMGDIRESMEAFDSFLSEFSAPMMVRAELPIAGAPALVEIPVVAGITVSMHMANPDGSTVTRGEVFAPRTIAATPIREWNNGVVELRGVPAEEGVEIWYRGYSPEYYRLQYPAGLGNQDVDLGDVVVPQYQPDAMLSMTVTESVATDSAGFAIGANATLIATDASRVLGFGLIAQTGALHTAREFMNEEVSVDVPAGEYFVVPGMVCGSNVLRVLELIAEGRAADLRNAGVPVVTCVSNQLVTYSINADSALDAIASVE